MRHATNKRNADKSALIAAVRARGFSPADDNETDTIAQTRRPLPSYIILAFLSGLRRNYGMDAKKEKRAIIVRAALDVLMTSGVQSLTFDAIARSAGLSRQLIRYYFEDREAIMIALCDHLADIYRNALIGGVAGIEDNNRLSFFFDFYFDLLCEHRKPRDDQAYDAVFAWAAGSEAVRSDLCRQYGLLGHVVAHEIALQYPNLSSDDCGELSYLFVSLMYGHWKMVATLGFAEDHKHVARRALDRLIESYVRNSHDRPVAIKPWGSEG